jgi:hypothetical protein
VKGSPIEQSSTVAYCIRLRARTTHSAVPINLQSGWKPCVCGRRLLAVALYYTCKGSIGDDAMHGDIGKSRARVAGVQPEQCPLRALTPAVVLVPLWPMIRSISRRICATASCIKAGLSCEGKWSFCRDHIARGREVHHRREWRGTTSATTLCACGRKCRACVLVLRQ